MHSYMHIEEDDGMIVKLVASDAWVRWSVWGRVDPIAPPRPPFLPSSLPPPKK